MTRYRLRPHTVDHAEGHLWIAPLPEGPIARIDGVGVQILHVLEGRPGLTVAEVAASLGEQLEEIPDGAELEITAFLQQLDRAGVVEMLPAR